MYIRESRSDRKPLSRSMDSGYINYYAREGKESVPASWCAASMKAASLKELFDANKAEDTQLSDSDLSDIRSEITGYMNGFDRKQISGYMISNTLWRVRR